MDHQAKGALTLRVPRPYTASRPAVRYTHVTHAGVRIADDPLASTLPVATAGPSIQRGPPDFRPYAAAPGAPETLEDYLAAADAPQLSLHVTSFADATLVGLAWPHTLMDVVGQGDLLRAWSLVLAGRDADVPPVLGAREDAVVAAASVAPSRPGNGSGDAQGHAPTPEWGMTKQLLTGWGMLAFGLRFAWDLLWSPPVSTRTVFLPRAFVASLRRRALQDLAVEGEEEKQPFVSDGDVLTAWFARALAASQPTRPLTVLHALNARFRLPELAAASSGGVYLQNMAVGAFAFLAPDLAAGPLGPAALENRRCLVEQAAEGQVRAFIGALRAKADANGGVADPATMLCGPTDAVLAPFTNWARADLFNAADFSAAVLGGPGAEEEGGARRDNHKPGRIVFHHAQSMRQSAGARNVVVVLGKDTAENYWVQGLLVPATWARIEEEMKTR